VGQHGVEAGSVALRPRPASRPDPGRTTGVARPAAVAEQGCRASSPTSRGVAARPLRSRPRTRVKQGCEETPGHQATGAGEQTVRTAVEDRVGDLEVRRRGDRRVGPRRRGRGRARSGAMGDRGDGEGRDVGRRGRKRHRACMAGSGCDLADGKRRCQQRPHRRPARNAIIQLARRRRPPSPHQAEAGTSFTLRSGQRRISR